MRYRLPFIFPVIARKPKATWQSIFLKFDKLRARINLMDGLGNKMFDLLCPGDGLPRRKLLAMTGSVGYASLLFSLITFGLINTSACLAANPYQQMQQITASAMLANGDRMKNEAENMAGSKVPGYIPKRVPVTVQRDRGAGINKVVTQKPQRDMSRTKVVYDPYHPQADAQGMVTMPDVDPMVSLMNLQDTKADNERAMKAYQMATDQRHRILSMINH